MSKVLDGSALSVVFDRTGGRFVLESARLQALKTLIEVEKVGAEEVATLNALLHLEHGRASALVRFAGVQQVDGGGGRVLHAHQHEAADARDYADAEGGVAFGTPRPPQAAVRVQMRDANHTVAKVLRLYGATPGGSWSDLWPIAELIWDDLGGRDAAAKALQVEDETERFGATANNPHVAGDKARHGVFKKPLPRRTMSLTEAQDYVDAMVKRWLATKGA